MRFSKAGLVAASVSLFVSGLSAQSVVITNPARTITGPAGSYSVSTTATSAITVTQGGYTLTPDGNGTLQFDSLTFNPAAAGSVFTLTNAAGRLITANSAAGVAMNRIVFDNDRDTILGTSPGQGANGVKGRVIFEKTGSGMLQYTSGGVRQSLGVGYSDLPDVSPSPIGVPQLPGSPPLDQSNYAGALLAGQNGNTGEFIVSEGVLRVSGAINNWLEFPENLGDYTIPVMTGASRTTVLGGAELDFTNTEYNVGAGAHALFGGSGAGTPTKRYNFVQNLTAGSSVLGQGVATARLNTGTDNSYRIIVHIDQSVLFGGGGFDYGLEADGVTARSPAARSAVQGSIGVITGGGDVLRTGAGTFTIYGDATPGSSGSGLGRLILAGGSTILASTTGQTVSAMRSLNLAGTDALRGDATNTQSKAATYTSAPGDVDWAPGVAPAALGSVDSASQATDVANGFVAKLLLANDQTVHNLQADYAYGAGVGGSGLSATVENAVIAARVSHAEEAILPGLGVDTTINLSGHTLTIQQDRDGVFQGGIISLDSVGNYIAGGNLVKTGAGTLALIAGGDYEYDSIEIREGALLASAGALAIGTVDLSAGGTLTIVQPNAENLRANLIGTGTLRIGTRGTVTSDTGETLAVNGANTAGSILFARVQSFAGDLVITEGVTANFTSAFNNAIAQARSVTLDANGSGRETRLAIGDSLQQINNLRGDVFSRLDLGRGVATLRQTEDSTFLGAISGVGNLVKTGSGNFTVTGSATHYGATVAADGSLSLASTGGLANTSALVVGATGQVSATGNQNVGALFGSSGAQVNIDGGNLTVGLSAARNAALTNELAFGNTTPLSSNYLGTSATALDLGNAAIGSFDTALLGAVPTDVADATRLFLQNVAYRNARADVASADVSAAKAAIDTAVLAAADANANPGDTTKAATALAAKNAAIQSAQVALAALSAAKATPISTVEGANTAPVLAAAQTAIDSMNAVIAALPTNLGNAQSLAATAVTDASAYVTAGDTIVQPLASTLAYLGTISGNGGLTKIGSEKLTLTGVSTYTGATAVQGGELRVDFDAISSTSGVAISTGAILAINADNTLDGAGNHDFTRVLTGTGSINKVGDGEVTLTGDISGFTGTMNVNEGTLRFNVEQTIPTAVTVAVGATLALDAPSASAVVNYTGSIANNGTIEKDGLGKVILVNAPAPTGNIFVKEGTLSVGAVPTGTLDIASGATYELRVPGTGQPGAPMSFTGALTGVVGSTFSFARGDASSPAVSDYLVTLAPNPAPSTFAGTLRGDNVTLVMGADNILPTASIDLINGAVLDLNGTTQSFTGLSGDATSQISLANGTLTFNVADTAATPDLVFAGNVTGPGFINKDGLGTLSLRGITTGSVTFTVLAGTLESTPDALGAGNGVFVDAGAVFAVRNDDTSTAIQFDNGVNGAGTLAKTGLGEVQIGSVTVSGGVAVQEGRLTITGATDSSVFKSVDVSAGATYQVNLPAGGLVHDSDSALGEFVTGAGNLAVSGPETLTLAGATQSYTGNTILMDGATLDLATNGVVSLNGLDSGMRDASDIHVADSGLGTTVNTTGTLTVIQSRYGVFDGQFTPATALTVQGTAALEITGDLAAHGLSSVTVDAGILKVDTTNTTAVDLINAGELRVNVTGANEIYSGVVTSGDNTGRFVKSGTGTLDFASTVSGGALDNFTGTVGVVEGVLRLDTATLGANVTGLTTDGTGTLELGASTPSRVDLAITGTGAVTIVGPQKVSFGDGVTTGVTGNPYVLQSTGLLTVASGATLGGVFNTSGDLVVASGGTLAPGNSPGVVNVGGNFNLAVGGTLEVEVNATTSDQVIVTGSATLAGALVVKQDNTPGSAKPGKGQTYTILTAAGGITGSFSNAVGGVVQLAPDEIAKTGIARVRIQNTGTTLTMTTVGAIAGLAGIHDGLGGLVASIDAGTLPTAVQTAVDGAAPGSVATIVNNLSPLGYAAEYAMAQDADNRLHSALHDRLEQRRYDRASSMTLDEAEWEAFASATGSFADNKQATDTPTFNYRTFGGIAGLDKKLSDDLTVGAAVAYDTGTADIHDNGGKIEMSRATLTVFGGTQITSRWYVDGGLTGGYGQFDGKRETVLGKLKATNDGLSVGGFVETGTIFAVTKDFHITPYAGAAYTHHEFDGFTENGASGVNASALKAESWSNDSLRVKVGSGFAWFVPLDEVKLKLGLDAAFAHELIDTDSDIEASFASGGSKFTTTAAALPQDSVALTPSIGVQIDESLSASFGYSYEMGFDGRSYQSVNFTVRKRF